MKIDIFSREHMAYLIATKPTDKFYSENNFISIASVADNDVFETEYPHKIELPTIFKGVLDPPIITNPSIYKDIVFKQTLEQYKVLARDLIKWLNTIDKTKPLLINCAGGNTRSGTVGYCINRYINKYDYPDDYQYFIENYSFIVLCPTIQKFMDKTFTLAGYK